MDAMRSGNALQVARCSQTSEDLMKKLLFVAVLVASAAMVEGPAQAFPAAPSGSVIQKTDDMLAQVQFRGHGKAGVKRPAVGRPGKRPAMGRPGHGRPGMGRPIIGRPNVGRPGFGRPAMGYVHRPWRGRYWRPGVGWAVGSVVAIGVLAAAAAAAYAPPPPGPGYCWYYTDPTYRAGYWAACQ
jgi:hypothetical protein